MRAIGSATSSFYDAEEGGALGWQRLHLSGVNLTREITLDKDLAKVTGTAPNEVLYPDALTECLPMDKALSSTYARTTRGRRCADLHRWPVLEQGDVHGEQGVPGKRAGPSGAARR